MLKVSVSGIRGVWGESLDHQVVLDYLKSFAHFLGQNRKIAIGSDTRTTRSVIKYLIQSVFESYGFEIIDLGIIPTPLVLFCVQEMDLDGGIVISASHNPAPWNALKLIKKGGFFLNQAEMTCVEEYYNNKDFIPLNYQNIGKTIQKENILDEYFKKAEKMIDFDLIRKSGFKVSADAVNGTANQFLEKFFQILNIKHQVLFTDIHKEFERGAEPLPENLKELGKTVLNNQSDLGLAYDPDGDRLAIVDEKGFPIGEDWTLAIAYLNILQKEKTDIVVNLSTSMIIDEIAKKENTNVFKAKVGEINVTEEMLKRKIFFGGEGNGGVIYTRINHCRDSIIATLLILEYLAKNRIKISEIVSQFPKIKIIKDKLVFTKKLDARFLEEKIVDFIQKSGLSLRSTDLNDGIRIDYESGWIQVRASNTEPIIRIMGENKDHSINLKLSEYIKNVLSSL
ncbi:MAG: hypothetical protein A2Y41_01410 [Spirochaetes bacterium GWB1_36_13]|nr:MAG: hypothetical protein A2Y41_01410 [Spirochaetes bacterium GWB1_36_13]